MLTKIMINSNLAPGGAQILTVQMVPGSNLTAGATKSATLRVHLNGSDTTVRDVVRAVATVTAADDS